MTGDEAFRILYAKLKKAGASGEQIQQAVNKYLEENPVQGGITCEDAEALMHKNSASGIGILLKDAAGWRVPEMHLYGKATQFTTTGAQLFDVDAVGGPYPIEADEDGWYNVDFINSESNISNKYKNISILPSTLIEPSKRYVVITEISEISECYLVTVSGHGANKNFIGQLQPVSGYRASFNTIGVHKTFGDALEDLSIADCLTRFFIEKNDDAEACHVKFRLSVLKDTSVTAENFVYEPYTGGKPSPNPNYPQVLVSLAGNGELTVTTTGEEKQSSAKFLCPNGLPGIPVTSGGNYTDENGQQWISDEIVCYPDGTGEYVKRINTKVFDGEESWKVASSEHLTKYYIDLNDATKTKGLVVFCDRYLGVNKQYIVLNNFECSLYQDINDRYQNSNWLYLRDDTATGVEDLTEKMKANPITVRYVLKEPIRTQLTAEELAAFKALRTYKPNTTVMNDAGAHMELEYITDPVAEAQATADKIEEIRSSSLEKTIENHYALQRTGKVYQTKLWKYAANPTSTGEKLRDNAGLVFEPSTDTAEGQDDYADIPLFQWVNVNYIRDADGSPRPVALEGTDAYQTSGAVDVGAMQMSFWWNWDSSNAEYDLITISDTPHPELGLVPWCECVRADGTVMPWCIGSKYFSGVASDGLLRSQPGLALANFQSHNNMITNYQKKGPGYWGAGTSRNLFQIIFNAIKGGTKNSQSLYAGCTSYSFQYSASIERTEEKTYFPLTNAQAANVIVGSRVYVGYGSNNNGTVNQDRSVTTMRAYADMAKVLKIEALDDSNMAVYLDVAQGFPTEPIALTDDLSAPVVISTMEWASGETDKVIGRHDGSPVSNTDGKHPYRVQGREYAVGCYAVASDTVMDFQSDYSKNVYVAPKGTAHSSADATIRSNYKLVGNIPAMEGGADWWIGDITVDAANGVWFPSVPCSSNAQGMGDRCYAGGASTSGTREYLQGGSLGNGSSAGSACLYCRGSLSGASWYCGGCD